MEHTEGKLKQGVSNTLIYANDVRIADCLVGSIVHEECEANAEHLVKCWNSHDDLLAACKNVQVELRLLLNLAALEPDIPFREKRIAAVTGRIKQVEQAIKNAQDAPD